MKDCNHPQLQKIKKLRSGSIICPDCKSAIGFLSDKTRELMRELFQSDKKSKPISNNNEIGSLYGVPVYISKMENEK